METIQLETDPIKIKERQLKEQKEVERTDTKKNLEKYAVPLAHNEVSFQNSSVEDVEKIIQSNQKNEFNH